jgi:hypothetical protein
MYFHANGVSCMSRVITSRINATVRVLKVTVFPRTPHNRQFLVGEGCSDGGIWTMQRYNVAGDGTTAVDMFLYQTKTRVYKDTCV